MGVLQTELPTLFIFIGLTFAGVGLIVNGGSRIDKILGAACVMAGFVIFISSM